MTQYIWIGILALVVVVWFIRSGPSLGSLLNKAIKTKDVTPIVEAAKKMPERKQPRFFQEAISQLWNTWNRDLAALLVKEFAIMHPGETIVQYWMKQVLEIEPKTAREHLDEEFLSRYYVPEVAASCGVASS